MKTERPDEKASRREFFRGSARYALLAGLAAVSAMLIKKHGAGLPGQTCINEGICRGCAVFAGCGLPQALSAKQFQREKSSDPTDEKSQQIPAFKSSSAGTSRALDKRNRTS